MVAWLLLGLLLTCAYNSRSVALELRPTLASNASTTNSSIEVQGNKLPWIACNAPPRYNIALGRSHCQNVYDRIHPAPHNYRKQGWHGVNTPETLTEESDDCVMRLETNYRDQSDTFARALMAHVGLHVSQRCILGGAASIGSKGFCELNVLSIGQPSFRKQY